VSRERARPAVAAPTTHHVRPSNPVFALQRAAGNRATTRLLQREPSRTARLAKIAKQLRADQLAHVSVDERDIHCALRVKDREDHGVRPGLNIVANLPSRGRTGFVDPDGRYHGDFVSATRKGALPGIAIMLGPLAFDEGDETLLATLRHELAHAQHDQMVLDWLTRWRASAQPDFNAWALHQKASPADRALVRGLTLGQNVDTELPAHIEGFAAVFDKTPPPSTSMLLKSSLPPAIEELRGAADRGWTGVDKDVRAAAEQRLATFYGALDGSRQALLRDWLFYLRYRATTQWPKDAKDDDSRAAQIVWNLFHAHIGFLDWLLRIVAGVQFKAHPLPEPSNHEPVTVTSRPRPVRTIKVGAGKVRAFVDVGFDLRNDSRSHGISLSYDGRDAPEMRWLQFIWREVVPDRGRPVAATLYHQGAAYPLTTNPSEPSQVGWNTDSATYVGGPQAAFYELDNALNRSAGKLEMFDEPGPPSATDVNAAFGAQPAGNGVTSRAHLVQYLVKGANVLFRSEFEVEYRFAQPTDRPTARPKLIDARPATALDPGPRARLHGQFKELDYLP
jgi:hypothetical protein